MIGQNHFIGIVKLDGFNSYSANQFELIDPHGHNAKLDLIINSHLVKANPVSLYHTYTVSNNRLLKIPVSFVGENKQFLIFINKNIPIRQNAPLFEAVDKYLAYRLGNFWLSSKTDTFKNISYPNYTYDLLSFAQDNPTSITDLTPGQ